MNRMHKYLLGLLAAAGLGSWLIISGCEGTGGTGGGPALFSPAGDTEKWTILCRRLDEPGHAQQAETLANMLRQVKQLNPKAVRVAGDTTESRIYYGEYRRVPSPKSSDQLAFSQEFQRDMALIRSLTDGVISPFMSARAEPIGSGSASAHPEWEATKAPTKYSLLIAVFYNTEGFQQRREAAEQYVEILRKDGFAAYYYHEQVKSFVYVGEFSVTDVVDTPEGRMPGPRVEQMIARREDEFRHFTENGHIRKYYEGPGKAVSPLSQVVPLPRADGRR